MSRAARRAAALVGLCVTLGLSGCEPGGDSAESPERPSEREDETAVEGGPAAGGQARPDTYMVYFLRSEEVVANPGGGIPGAGKLRRLLELAAA